MYYSSFIKSAKKKAEDFKGIFTLIRKTDIASAKNRKITTIRHITVSKTQNKKRNTQQHEPLHRLW